MSLLPGTRLGVYEITGALGAGGMGEVYRARDTRLDRDVAIKILPDLFAQDPGRLLRFDREAKTLASLGMRCRSVDITFAPALSSSPPHVLFKGSYMDNSDSSDWAAWDVVPDGKTFVLLRDFSQPGNAVTMVQGWLQAVNR